MSLLLIGHSYPQTSSGSPAMGFNPGLRESPREHVTVMMPRPTPQRLSFDWAGVGPRHLHARVRKLAWRGDFLNVRSGFHNRVPTKFSFLSLHTLTPARPAPVPVPACSATPSGACSLHPNPAELCAPWGTCLSLCSSVRSLMPCPGRSQACLLKERRPSTYLSALSSLSGCIPYHLQPGWPF